MICSSIRGVNGMHINMLKWFLKKNAIDGYSFWMTECKIFKRICGYLRSENTENVLSVSYYECIKRTLYHMLHLLSSICLSLFAGFANRFSWLGLRFLLQ